METTHNFFKRFLIGIAAMVLAFSAAPYMPVRDNASVAAAAQARLNTRKVTLRKGGKKTLKLKNAPGKVVWKSSRKGVASVSKKGVVTAKKAGKAVITATCKNKKYKCTVTVTSGGKKKSSNGNKASGGTVYWVSGGSVYHVSRNCPTLARSKTVYSGSVSSSGKSRGCKVCS